MKSLCLLVLSTLRLIAHAAPVKLAITVTDPSGDTLGANIVFTDAVAYEYGPEITPVPLATFNLTAPGWSESRSGKHVTLAQARDWAATSKTQALASMDRLTNADQRAFLQGLLSPQFEVGETTAGIELKSRFVQYTASEPLELGADLKRQIAQFDELNAYRKAMQPRQPPPFTQLEVARVLREKDLYPGLLVMTLTTPNGTVRVSIRYEVLPLTSEEHALLPKPGL